MGNFYYNYYSYKRPLKFKLKMTCNKFTNNTEYYILIIYF